MHDCPPILLTVLGTAVRILVGVGNHHGSHHEA